MITFSSKLDNLEAKLQSFIEGKLSRLSPLGGSYEELSRQLVSSMQANTITSGDGILLAPDHFTLLVHPSNLNDFSKNPDILVEMADLIHTVGKTAGLHFSHPPVVTVSPNNDVQRDKIDIITRISDQVLGHTANLNKPETKNANDFPKNAFLIVNGVEEFPLNETVINIGRQSSNHLHFNDTRVSRQHAQIRAMYGRYEIFDLDSTGGTYINKKRIKQSLLRPGDVISIAGIYLIYGQESVSRLIDTKELTPSQDPVNPDL